jgi:hypothetical protein
MLRFGKKVDAALGNGRPVPAGESRRNETCALEGGKDPRANDQPFPGLDGRPDLVIVESGFLIVYECKPLRFRGYV